MTISIESTVGQIATEHPLATRIFGRHGIDFCCGGGRTIREACEAKGLDTDSILEEIRGQLAESDADLECWNEAPLNDLVEHILAAYHRPLDEELPRLEQLARKVHRVHGERHPEVLPELLSTYLGLKGDLQDHMMKEEEILFPMIRQDQGSMADGPISVMESEHESAGDALKRLRKLTNGYQVPAEACNTWRALWAGLAALESALHEHIHLENNVLFPRALAS